MSLDGKVLGVLGDSGKQLKEFGWIHEIACPSENETLCRRIAELADTETDFASEEIRKHTYLLRPGEGGEVSTKPVAISGS